MSNNPEVVFIYDRSDAEEVSSIRQAVLDLGVLVWIDRNMGGGVEILRAILEQIEKAKCGAVFFGREGQLTKWQGFEVDTMWLERLEGSYRIIPVILSTAPSDFQLPKPLNRINAVDFRETSQNPLTRLVLAIRSHATGGQGIEPQPSSRQPKAAPAPPWAPVVYPETQRAVNEVWNGQYEKKNRSPWAEWKILFASMILIALILCALGLVLLAQASGTNLP